MLSLTEFVRDFHNNDNCGILINVPYKLYCSAILVDNCAIRSRKFDRIIS